jgi:hypothetical protein
MAFAQSLVEIEIIFIRISKIIEKKLSKRTSKNISESCSLINGSGPYHKVSSDTNTYRRAKRGHQEFLVEGNEQPNHSLGTPLEGSWLGKSIASIRLSVTLGKVRLAVSPVFVTCLGIN